MWLLGIAGGCPIVAGHIAPCPSPADIIPCKKILNVDILAFVDNLSRTCQQVFLVVEPIVIDAETADAIFLGSLSLPDDVLFLRQVLVVVMEWHFRLLVALIERLGIAYRNPVSKAFPPEHVVLGNLVILGQVHR